MNERQTTLESLEREIMELKSEVRWLTITVILLGVASILNGLARW
jgi:hypothetical protein